MLISLSNKIFLKTKHKMTSLIFCSAGRRNKNDKPSLSQGEQRLKAKWAPTTRSRPGRPDDDDTGRWGKGELGRQRREGGGGKKRKKSAATNCTRPNKKVSQHFGQRRTIMAGGVQPWIGGTRGGAVRQC